MYRADPPPSDATEVDEIAAIAERYVPARPFSEVLAVIDAFSRLGQTRVSAQNEAGGGGGGQPQKVDPPKKPKYCTSAGYHAGKALDLAGRMQQYIAVGAFVFSGGAAAQGALPAYGLGTAFRLGGTLLRSFSGDSGATADLAGAAIIKLAAPPEFSPLVDSTMDYVADRVKDSAFKDLCA